MGEDRKYTVVYDALVVTTPQSWLLVIDEQEYWFPKSKCTIDEDAYEIIIPEWLLIKKELESYIDDEFEVENVW